MTQVLPAVMSTAAKGSGEISLPNDTYRIEARDFSTQRFIIGGHSYPP